MSKVDIRRLDSVTANDTTATALINENFEKLQAGIEDALSRTGKTPNFMDADLDMNSRRIINCGEAVEDNDVVTYKVVKDAISTAQESATSAANSAAQAATSAQSALVSSTSAINAVRNAEDTLNLASGLLVDTQNYVDSAKVEIDGVVQEAKDTISETITSAVEDVKQAAIEAADETVQATIGMSVDAAAEHAREAKAWARGEDAEVEEFAPGEEEHSSRGYADLAMAIANTPEDVPVDTSTLLALQIIKGPKGDSSVGAFTGNNTIDGTLNVVSDDNHPVKITGMAGTSATGYQIADSNGLGDSDFEHYATGDRYGTKITNHNNTSNTSVSIDMYQSNVGKSVIDFSEFDTMFAPALLKTLYPVGSIYITTNTTCPLETLGVGTWELVAADRVLQGAGSRGAVGSTLEESLPNIKGSMTGDISQAYATGALKLTNAYNGEMWQGAMSVGRMRDWELNASLSNSTYQDNAPVQPAAYLVNIFRRIS